VNLLIICVMGVAGSGKSTVGSLLASELHCDFLDADTLHSPANIQKMTHGIPLTDADRAPWLAAVHARIVHSVHRREALVVACSALKLKYRDTIGNGLPVVWVYLKGSKDVIRERLLHRKHHFMKAEMLACQFADLEEPANAVVVDIAVNPLAAVRQILNEIDAARVGAVR
jgi:gluconokinase